MQATPRARGEIIREVDDQMYQVCEDVCHFNTNAYNK